MARHELPIVRGIKCTCGRFDAYSALQHEGECPIRIDTWGRLQLTDENPHRFGEGPVGSHREEIVGRVPVAEILERVTGERAVL